MGDLLDVVIHDVRAPHAPHDQQPDDDDFVFGDDVGVPHAPRDQQLDDEQLFASGGQQPRGRGRGRLGVMQT